MISDDGSVDSTLSKEQISVEGKSVKVNTRTATFENGSVYKDVVYLWSDEGLYYYIQGEAPLDNKEIVKIIESFEAIVATIISMAKHLNMNVIAEGIETQGQLDFLTENACKEIQGYYFSHPLPATEVEEAFFMPVREGFDHPL